MLLHPSNSKVHFSHSKHARFHVLGDEVCFSGLHFKFFHVTFFSKGFIALHCAAEAYEEQGGRKRKGWKWNEELGSKEKNLRYKDNECLICFTYGLNS